MVRFKKWAGREYGERTRLVAIFLGGIFFWILIPACIVFGAYCLDRWFCLPRFVYGSVNGLVVFFYHRGVVFCELDGEGSVFAGQRCAHPSHGYSETGDRRALPILPQSNDPGGNRLLPWRSDLAGIAFGPGICYDLPRWNYVLH